MFNRFKKCIAIFFVALCVSGYISSAVTVGTAYAESVSSVEQAELEKAANVLSDLFYEVDGKLKINNLAFYKHHNYLQKANNELRKFVSNMSETRRNGENLKIDLWWLAGCSLNETGKEIVGILSIGTLANIFAGETVKIGAVNLIKKIVAKLVSLGVKSNVYALAAALVLNAVRCEMGWT